MKRNKNNRPLASIGRFTPIPHRVINSPAYQALSHTAARLLWDIASQYRGDDNGRLLAGYGFMSERGWKSSGTLYKARKELVELGFIYQTVQGHRPNKASWYAITWWTLDKLNGYDYGAEHGFTRWAFEKTFLNPVIGQQTSVIHPKNRQELETPYPINASMKQHNASISYPSNGHPLEKPSLPH